MSGKVINLNLVRKSRRGGWKSALYRAFTELIEEVGECDGLVIFAHADRGKSFAYGIRVVLDVDAQPFNILSRAERCVKTHADGAFKEEMDAPEAP